jgi:bifunctional non-homologous end joining protein LigD
LDYGHIKLKIQITQPGIGNPCLGFYFSNKKEHSMNALHKISLYYSEGSSNKEYHAEIVEAANGSNVVNFRYGRRGGALTSGTKTASPVDFSEAKKIYDKLVKEKTAKGYTPDQSGSSYQNTEQAGNKSDFLPQLLNPISEKEAMNLITDKGWTSQEKMDGERRAAHAENGSVIGINRKGLIVALPQAIVDELQALASKLGAIRVDGEIIGDILYVFDLHVYKGKNLHAVPWLVRIRLAQTVLSGCKYLKAVPVAVTTTEKLSLWGDVSSAKGEGVVFKHKDSFVCAGRPNSGGDWLKCKFTASASCCVLEINKGKRSIKIGLLTSDQIITVGNVTIPFNHDVPAAGDIVEVEYLYAYRGGSLYQPVYRGIREDLDMSACYLNQLKYKPVEKGD